MKLGLRLQSLVAWALSLALVTIALPQLNAQNPVITLKTSKTKGEKLLFNIYPKASFTIEGVKANGIDPETNKQIYILDSEDGKISISGPVLFFECSGENITSLDVSKNSQLKVLDCSQNSLTSLDVSKNTNIGTLNCSNNNLSSLSISKNTVLSILKCSDNRIASLDLSKNTGLFELICSNNKLTSLDLSKQNRLQEVHCDNNQLSSLIVSKQATGLVEVRCTQNQIQGASMDALIASLPKLNNPGSPGVLAIYDNSKDSEHNTCTSAQTAAAKKLGWLPYTYNRDTKTWIEYTPATFFITYAQPSNGVLTVKNGASTIASQSSVEIGTQLTVVATANQGYELEALMINNKKVNPTFDPTLRTYKANFIAEKATTISATFKRKIEKVTITYKPATNGNLIVKQGANTLASGASVEKGTQLTVVATANQGYELEALIINNKKVENPTFDPALRTYKANFTAEKTTTISATFKRKIEKVTITYKPATNGSLVVKQGANTLASGTSVEKGTQLTIVATANQGYELEALMINNKKVENPTFDPALRTYKTNFTAEKATTISATFKRKIEKVTITYKPATNGNLVVKQGTNTLASGSSVEKGTQLTVVATANQGYELEALMINNKKVENPTFDPALRTYKTNFTAEKATTISATFKRKIEKVTITYKPATNGNLVVKQGTNTLASGSSVEKGTQLAIVATANQGYELEALMINNKKVENPTFDPTLRTYKTNFTAEKATTISATFKRKIEKVAITYKPATNGNLIVKQGANTLASGTSVEKGTQLTVVATANQGYELKNGKVLLGNKELVLTREGQAYTGTFVVEASVEISAEFTATTALSAIDSPSILVYPNPASHKVQISNANPNSEVALYNMDGLLLQQVTTNAEGEVTLPVATLPTGHYLVRIGSSSVLVDIRR
ncbi:T9SS type A sorting domain-containing protein [Porphyromonas endodontalis]|uniref:InlB B-repeat-containing protein n=1 Tax=Porphyromonas endodontalis TaxID=28124 RepID=UPI0028EE6B10|nr:T9SS type A sorting domain-containing protein [Porphyromonas endodontalis]